MRLDKFLSHHLGISRSQLKKELRAGKVSVDDQIIKASEHQINSQNTVKYNQTVIEHVEGKRYFMLHKPQGYVCSNCDENYPSILYFIDEPMSDKLHSAGRLDVDTTGLVLLTDDGQWSHKITSPKTHCTKRYLATLSYPLTEELIDHFAKGIALKGEKSLTKPAKLEILDHYQAALTISEGRYHQVKRMFAALGNHVTKLHRQQIGSLILDVPEGQYRRLTEQEVLTILS